MKKQLILCGLAFYFLMSSVMATPTVIHVNKTHPLFSIKLAANATTGYSWVLGKHHPFIQLITSTYYPSANKQLIGAPGYTVFQFKVSPSAFVHATQTMPLELLYQRPWNHQTGSKRDYDVVINPY